MSNASGDDTPLTQESTAEICKYCGREKEALHICGCTFEAVATGIHIGEPSASGDDEELSKLLDEAFLASEEWAKRDTNGVFSNRRVCDARKSLESLFGRITRQRDDAESILDSLFIVLQYQPAKDSDIVAFVRNQRAELGRIREELKEAEEDAAQYDALREAYEQLEASHLSPEEARCAVGLLWGMAGTDFEKAIVEKLRSISGGALKEGATQ